MFAKRTILQALAQRRFLLFSISMVVMLSMGSNALAAVLCPHMSGSDEVCATGGIGDHAPTDTQVAIVTDSEKEADAEHCAHHADAEAPSDMPDSDEAESADNRVSTESAAITESITLPADGCSHCMMHSQQDPTGLFQAVIQKTSTQESGPTVATSLRAKVLHANHSFFDIHDHSPPGASNTRYLLINVFRI